MIAAEKQVEISKLGVDAYFGYTQAAINAAFETTARALAVWTQVAHALAPRQQPVKEETWEWSGAPRRPHSSLFADEKPVKVVSAPPDPFTAWATLLQETRKTWFTPQVPSPFAWWAWTPQSAIPATWPWAYGLMSSGVPGSVAWPMAEANVALLDAAKKTADAARAPFPTYQSGNGFATAQVWTQSEFLKTFAAVAPAAAMIWPWLDRAA